MSDSPIDLQRCNPVPAHEHWVCRAGSGECLEPAVVCRDDGYGGDFYLCAVHHAQFEEMEAWLARDPANAERLERAIRAAE